MQQGAGSSPVRCFDYPVDRESRCMTPLEAIGLIAVGGFTGRLLGWVLRSRVPVISLEDASKQMEKSVREAFEAGMLCAADIVTHSGNEELAGDIRKTVEYVRADNN